MTDAAASLASPSSPASPAGLPVPSSPAGLPGSASPANPARRSGRPKPLIGVLPRTERRSKNNGWALVSQRSITEALRTCGALPVVLAETVDPDELSEYVDELDGFVVPGGGDVEPELYGQRRLPECGPTEPYLRDAFEMALVPLVVAADKPLLGICRGNQVLNVALGGTLWQDLPSQLGTSPEPEDEDARRAVELAREGRIAHSQGRPFELHTHEVRVVEGTRLAGIVTGADALAGKVAELAAQAGEEAGSGPVVGETRQDEARQAGECQTAEDGCAPGASGSPASGIVANRPVDPAHLMVNSLHHQAVRDVAPGLEVTAYAPDGVIEGLDMPGKRFVMSVQWHPESLWEHDPAALAIFEAFVAAARARA